MNVMRRCLVTGGTGFLGRHFVEVLRTRDESVRVLSRRPMPEVREILGQGTDIVVGDLRDAATLRRALEGIDVVFNVAGAKRREADFIPVNVDGTRRLLAACCESGVSQMVHVSSAGVIGTAGKLLVSESTPCSPQNGYEQSKHLAEEVARGFRDRMAVTLVRPANVFGEADPERHLLALMQSLTSGRFRYVGKGDAMLNYVYVRDVAEACWALSVAPDARGETFIVSDPCALTDFVEAAADALGVAAPHRHVPVWLAWGAAFALDAAARATGRAFPLTRAKVHAARSRRVYSSEKLRRIRPEWPAIGWREGVRRTAAAYGALGLLA